MTWPRALSLRGLGVGAALGAIGIPLALAGLASLTPGGELLSGAGGWPERLVLDHYAALFQERNFAVPLRNSLVVAGATTALCVPLAALCAYALARLSFPGRALVLFCVLAISMFPQIAIVSPLYLLLRALGWINRYPGLVLPYLSFALPLAIWWLWTAFRELPVELEDAARIDGASRLRTLVEVFLPLCAPALASAAILTFVYAWNEFLFALAFTVGEELHTVPVAVALFRGQYQVSWGQILSASIVATAPVALVVLVLQRRILSGLVAGAMKG